MTTTAPRQLRTLEGEVQAGNQRGIKLQGVWVNLSRFGPYVTLPPRGSEVRVQADERGYIAALEVLRLADPATAAPAGPPSDRATRLEVLKAAAAYAGASSGLTDEDVLVIADRWLSWLEDCPA